MNPSQPADRAAHAVRVLLANQHALVRAGIRALLEEQLDIEVVAEADGPEETLLASPQQMIDVVVVDADDRSRPFIEQLAEPSRVRILAMTASADPEQMLHALRMGAAGAIPHSASAAALSEAVRALALGLRWVTPDLEDYCRRRVTTTAQELAKPAEPRDADWDRLTPREREVATLVGQGLRHGEIAERLRISVHTVKNHLRHVFVKLDVAGRVELAVYVRR